MTSRACALLALAAAIFALPAQAAEWPTGKPIRLIVTFAPGGAADLLGRIAADHLQTELKQTGVVENRGGAAGMLAATQVARAEPDGYTLLLSGLGPNVIAPAISANPGYDSLRDFTHIAYLGGPPVGWVVAPSTGIASVADALARAREQKLAGYATSGVGTLGHLVAEYIVQKTGTPMTHIPYTTAVMTDLLAGRVPMASYAWSSVMAQVQAGGLRALAVSSEARLPDFPAVPTFKELGFDLVCRTWFAVSGPKGVPAEIVARINKELIRMFDRPEVREKLATQAVGWTAMTPEELTRHFEAEIKLWTPIARAAGLKKE
jgi:tripartite-type tricarboxylate transporter receptor subunit TctC